MADDDYNQQQYSVPQNVSNQGKVADTFTVRNIIEAIIFTVIQVIGL